MAEVKLGDKVRVADTATTVCGGYVDPDFFGKEGVCVEIDSEGDCLVRTVDGDRQFISPEFLTLIEEEEVEPLKLEHLKVGQLVIRKSDGWQRFITAVDGDQITHKYGRKQVKGEDIQDVSDFLGIFRLPDILEVAQFKKDNPDLFAKYVVGEEPVAEAVVHPAHYGGDTTYEVIKVAEAWGFDKDAYLFNVLKYIARADHKGSEKQDLEKAKFYLERRISQL